jgi:hypothetical protein
VLAQLEALKTQGKTDRKYAAKRELILRLLRAGYGKTRTRSLLRFIDWIIRLPEELEQQLTREIETSTGGKNMPYVTSWERIAQKHGEEIGERKIVLRLLKQKPGDLDAEVTARIEQLSTSRLEKLVDALPGFSHPADLERWLKRKA